MLPPPIHSTYTTTKPTTHLCSQNSAFKKVTAPRASPLPNKIEDFSWETKGKGMGGKT